MDPMKESPLVVGVKSPIFFISPEMNIQTYDECKYFGDGRVMWGIRNPSFFLPSFNDGGM
jgi:hypothetical protein